ncbi:MAG TPA: DUF4188 domain-containing protein [Cytophagales bacterium]|nr:DUF4188 domain-containing protein [Cytophagales bacterium]HAA19725.1 DUF4188 domain-containing protein [Cytophagales bacterium]HAP61613.1 DUF4188 domain-containing protein [Cytophagales bacterium]
MESSQKVTAKVEPEEGLVVLLIGMRINKFWKVRKTVRTAVAMLNMLRELRAHPESGFLGGEQRLLGRRPIFIQYWKSYEQMLEFANDRQGLHFPAWGKFNKTVGTNGDVGIWHEAFIVKKYENVYVNMPPQGMGRFGKLVPVGKGTFKSVQRMEAAKGEGVAV